MFYFEPIVFMVRRRGVCALFEIRNGYNVIVLVHKYAGMTLAVVISHVILYSRISRQYFIPAGVSCGPSKIVPWLIVDALCSNGFA